MSSQVTRVCTKCGIEKEYTEFYASKWKRRTCKECEKGYTKERICPRCKLMKFMRVRQPYCKQCQNEWAKEWRAKNKSKVEHTYHVSYWKTRMGAILKLGGKCVRCGEADIRVLQINHKNGFGAKELRKVHPSVFYSNIVKGIRNLDDLEVLCANHNIIYEFEVGRRTLP